MQRKIIFVFIEALYEDDDRASTFILCIEMRFWFVEQLVKLQINFVVYTLLIYGIFHNLMNITLRNFITYKIRNKFL